MEIDSKTKKLKPTTRSKDKKRKNLSNMFTKAEDLEITAEKILEACPEDIPSSAIDINNNQDNNRKKEILKYKAKGKKYKWWNEDDRIRAATVYAMTGNAKRVEEITGIPSTTVRQWKNTEWWPQVIDRIRRDGDDELDVKLTGLIDKTTKEINERLDKGDYIYNTKTGDIVRKPIGGKDLSVMTSIFVDKRSLLRKKPKMGGDTSSTNERLKKLAEEFSKFVNSKTIPGEATQVINEDQGEMVNVPS
jgi:hypothetical protein